MNIGDKVMVYGNRFKSIRSVERITPKGNIRLSNGRLYNSDGREKTSDLWGATHFRLLTKELEEEFRKEEFVKSALSKMSEVKKINYKQAVELLKILQ